ncbi:hypothetical protein KPH14_012417 [Odynerus spinipes]|uniref:Uncharacterized protein n=1 Tax=Odynerus spinipes TaxID=1348599 RepID=A0AAD9VML4_9HYME|nr:hypothetical protein KPH14_012417 [Odynerus spinipes]
MSENDVTNKHVDAEEYLPPDTIELVKFLEGISNLPIITKFLKDNKRISEQSRKELFKQVINNEDELSETKKCMNEECTETPRLPSRLPHNVIQHWINTGYLPYQLCIDNAEHSDTGSSLSEEGLFCKAYFNSNVASVTHKLNDKQISNKSLSNSSVDTAAYILSNTNITKKENTQFKKLKMHEDINYKNNQTIDTMINIYDNINSNIFDRKCISVSYSDNKVCEKDKELEETNAVEEVCTLKLATSPTEDTNKICKNDKQVNGNDLSCRDKEEFTENSIEKAVNINNNNEPSFHFENLHNSSIQYFRQRKLYSGRHSPTDIIITKFKENNVDKKKKNSHPALRNSPFIQKSHRKLMHKRRKRKFFLKHLRNRSQEDNTSSDDSTNDDINEGIHSAKRKKTSEDIESHIVNMIPPTLGKEKLLQSYNALKEQIQRFSTSEFVDAKELTKLDQDYASQENIDVNGDKLHKYKLRSKKKVQNEEVIKEEIGGKTILHDKLCKKLNPIIVLERLSEKIIKHYTKRKDLQSETQEKKSNVVQITNPAKNALNLGTCSIISKDTVLLSGVENVAVDSVDSDVSTIIIYNHGNVKSTTSTKSDSTILSNDKEERSKLEKLLNDVKLKEKKPVVVLERMSTITSFKRKQLSRLNNFENKLQPVVVLEQIDNSNRNSNHSINSLACSTYNETNANDIESGITKKGKNGDYNNSTKVLRFQTNMNNSDSEFDSDVSFKQCTFSLCTSIRSSRKNETINKKSSDSLESNMSKNFVNTKNNKRKSSNRLTLKRKPYNTHMPTRDFNAHTSTNNEWDFPKKISSVDKVDNLVNNISRKNNTERVHTLTTTLFESDTSEEDEDVFKNNTKNTVINRNMNNKAKRFTLCTKAYDSDSDS